MKMKRIVCLLGLVLVFGLTASAQDVPKAEGFLGYSYVRVNPGQGLSGVNLNGGSGQISFNATNNFGIVADFGGYRVKDTLTTPLGPVSVGGNVFTYLFGPRVTYRGERVQPFVQALFGGARASASALGASASENAFAMALGGGVDVKVNDWFAVRPVQVDYLLTRFDESPICIAIFPPPPGCTGTTTQNNFRYSAGVVFRFGKR